MSSRTAVLGPLVAGLVAAGGIAWGLVDPPGGRASEEPSRTPRPSAQADALLGGLAPGDNLVGWQVTAVGGPDEEGAFRIDLAHRDIEFALMLVPRGESPEPAPIETEHYAIYYGHVRPPDTVLTRNVITATTTALARRVREHEAPTHR